jgi:serine-type D-Ala-D-Ala carboxypeptidase
MTQVTRDLAAVASLVVDDLRAAPCASVAAARREGGRWVYGAGAAGRLSFAPGAPLADVATWFDLASVSKPVTALALARLARAGVLGREEELAAVIPALEPSRSARVALDLFSAHRAGLDGHRPLFAPLTEGRPFDPGAALLTAADARRTDCSGHPPPGGFAPLYSDLGYLLLGAAIEARTGGDLDRVTHREVAGPLDVRIGSARQLRAEDPRFDDRVAATEDVGWRGGVIRGATHDENAWAYAGDGAAGHAGLFGDAISVVRLGVAVLEALAGERPGWLTPAEVEPLVRDRPGGSLLAGFDRRSGEAPLSGAHFGPRTFGHLGFTGTSLWIDPDAELVGVLLTNRVHPTRAADAIRRARPAAYDAIVMTMDQ